MSDQAPISTAPAADTPAASPIAQPQAESKAPEKLGGFIVDGQEHEVPLDELRRDYQKYKAADKRFQEAAQTRKQVEEFVTQFQPYLEAITSLEKDPWAVHKVAGLNYEEMALKFAYDKALQEYEESNLSPEQKRMKALEEKVASYERQQESSKQKEEQEREERKQQELSTMAIKAGEEIESDIVSAIQSSNVKPSKRLVARMAEEMINHLDSTGRPLSAKDALSRVRSEITTYSPEDLMAMLPEDVLEKIASSKLNKRVGSAATPTVQKDEPIKDKYQQELDSWLQKTLRK